MSAPFDAAGTSARRQGPAAVSRRAIGSIRQGQPGDPGINIQGRGASPDKAHRNQYDFIDGFARHMRDALPKAAFIGFTGTPIELMDKDTRAVFGDYISIYDIQRAVGDGLPGLHPLHTPTRETICQFWNPPMSCRTKSRISGQLWIKPLSFLEYSPHVEVRLVSHNGGIRWNSHWVNVSHVLAEGSVGLVAVDTGLWTVYVGPILLGRLNEEDLSL